MSERLDRKQILELADFALDYGRCCGGQIILRGYVCHRCRSENPRQECSKPRPGYGKKRREPGWDTRGDQ